MKKTLLLALPVVLWGCSDYSENSATCGILSFAGSAKVLQFMDENPAAALEDPPAGLQGNVLARVVGHGTANALAAQTAEGAVLGYEGEGFPHIPGFGVVLVDDSSEVMRGVLIYEAEPPVGYPQIGTIADATVVLPLYGVLINWSAVSDPECPLLREPEASTETDG